MRTKTNNIMKKANVLKNNLQFYISHNEVVYQVNDELMEVANEKEEMNRITLLNYLNATSTIEVFCKDHRFVKESFQDLNDWSQKDDVLFFLQTKGVLICVTRKEALVNELIAE